MMRSLSLAAFFYEEDSFGVFLLVTDHSWRRRGRACRPRHRADLAAVVADRRLYADPRRRGRAFIHFALFGGTLLSLHYYIVDSAICLAFGFVGFRAARASQMVSQYRWINAAERSAALAPQAALT